MFSQKDVLMGKNLLVGQSGGPSSVINSSLFGVVSAARSAIEIDKVFGMVNGIEGFASDKILDFDDALPGDKLNLLTTTPASYLGSCRYMLPQNLEDPIFPKLFELFEKYDIGYFLYIGGNDSMDTVSKISRYAKKVGSNIVVLGIPKTIDNDLVLTDHTPGFGSAAKYVASSVREITTDATVFEIPSVVVVEIMGRHAGWLTAASVLARRFDGDSPDLIYLPETDFDLDDFYKSLEEKMKTKNVVIVCISEGIHDSNSKLICEYEDSVGKDSFGHPMLSGAANYLKKQIAKRYKCKVRSIEFSIVQRCSAALISKTDRDEAIMAGEFGVKSAILGKTGYMIAFDRLDGPNYEIACSLQDVDEICNKEKKIPSSMISRSKNDMTSQFIDYCRPLIQGSVEVPIDDNGLQNFAFRK